MSKYYYGRYMVLIKSKLRSHGEFLYNPDSSIGSLSLPVRLSVKRRLSP